MTCAAAIVRIEYAALAMLAVCSPMITTSSILLANSPAHAYAEIARRKEQRLGLVHRVLLVWDGGQPDAMPPERPAMRSLVAAGPRQFSVS
ncbi:hypothetical protein [Aeromicrobium wangtongii]|uniref:Uncharacterized protein n=2 Tax=Aeromicrobium wangtongii TaxID=2969247 RepID=A0ABY5MDE5_9ACTN|nr:hypothetical protein [Aeromicrobium wangtongii]UUP15168.1 hypothetical protein NQV15_07625 [Aeromicrobium wangtongii]